MRERRLNANGVGRLPRHDAGRLLRPRHRHAAGDPVELPAAAGVREPAPLEFRPISGWCSKAELGFENYRARSGREARRQSRRCSPTRGTRDRREPDLRAFERTAAIDWRTSPGYSRRGGMYGVRHPPTTRTRDDDLQLHQRSTPRPVQHMPILRENWVLSLRGRLETTLNDDDLMPFFLLPALGGGSTLRGYGGGRFRDRHAMLMSAELRWFPNRLGLDMALFYDAGKVAPRASGSGLQRLEERLGHRRRFHGPAATVLRIEMAHGTRRAGSSSSRRARRSRLVKLRPITAAHAPEVRPDRPVVAVGRRAVGLTRVDHRRAEVLRRRPARARARDAGRLGRAAVGHRRWPTTWC